MLVLTRRVGERVLVGDDIELVVVEVKGDSIRLGIQAPRSTSILRAEVATAVANENASAAVAPPEVEKSLLEALSRHTAASPVQE